MSSAGVKPNIYDDRMPTITDSKFTYNQHHIIYLIIRNNTTLGKGKALPYSLPSIGPRADPSVQAVSPQVTISHPPSGRLPLLSTRPVFYLRKRSSDGVTPNWRKTSNCSLLLIYRPQRDERLSWTGWLTYSERITDHKWSPFSVSYRSSAGQGKVTGQRPTLYRCATQPLHYTCLYRQTGWFWSYNKSAS